MLAIIACVNRACKRDLSIPTGERKNRCGILRGGSFCLAAEGLRPSTRRHQPLLFDQKRFDLIGFEHSAEHAVRIRGGRDGALEKIRFKSLTFQPKGGASFLYMASRRNPDDADIQTELPQRLDYFAYAFQNRLIVFFQLHNNNFKHVSVIMGFPVVPVDAFIEPDKRPR